MKSSASYTAPGSVPGFFGTTRNGPRSIDVAARSLFESQVLGGTIASVVAEGALDHHFVGLFQHAAIRHDISVASSALDWLSRESEGLLAITEGVAPSACLYRALRTFLKGSPARALAADAKEWWAPQGSSLGQKLIRFRRALSLEEAEAMELCFARGLGVAETAAVLGVSKALVEERTARGLVIANNLFGRGLKGSSAQRDAALLQAFVLDPRHVRAPRRSTRKPALPIGTVINGRYELEALLGAGAFADVYRARDREVSDHVVALKILKRVAQDARATRAAMRELQLIASVFHPSVVQLKDHGWYEQRLWFVMPLYRGETLADRLRREPLGRREARQIFEALAEALAAMHRVGVRHQDIKPENVFLANIDPDADSHSSRVLPVLLDLGVAAKDAELVLAGTPAYFAPEVAARFASVPDPPPVGPKADVFSLALTLHFALDPRATSFSGRDAVDAFVSLRANHAPTPPENRELCDLRPHFERWLHLSPDARPSADEFRRELAALTRPEEQRARRLGLMRWLLPSAVAVLALFGAVVYALSREASLQRIETLEERLRADRARERAESIHASLEEEEARRKQLEADIGHLEAQYQNSRLTREQLAARLATMEGEFSLLSEQQIQQQRRLYKQREEIKTLREQVMFLGTDLDSVRKRRDELSVEVDRLRPQLDGERARRNDLEAQLESAKVRLQASEIVAAEARSRFTEVTRRLALLQEALNPQHLGASAKSLATSASSPAAPPPKTPVVSPKPTPKEPLAGKSSR